MLSVATLNGSKLLPGGAALWSVITLPCSTLLIETRHISELQQREDGIFSLLVSSTECLLNGKESWVKSLHVAH